MAGANLTAIRIYTGRAADGIQQLSQELMHGLITVIHAYSCAALTAGHTQVAQEPIRDMLCALKHMGLLSKRLEV